jgi:hypothetical protein
MTWTTFLVSLKSLPSRVWQPTKHQVHLSHCNIIGGFGESNPVFKWWNYLPASRHNRNFYIFCIGAEGRANSSTPKRLPPLAKRRHISPSTSGSITSKRKVSQGTQIALKYWKLIWLEYSQGSNTRPEIPDKNLKTGKNDFRFTDHDLITGPVFRFKVWFSNKAELDHFTYKEFFIKMVQPSSPVFQFSDPMSSFQIYGSTLNRTFENWTCPVFRSWL